MEPVKLRPAKCSLAIAWEATSWPLPWTRLITPGGRPASSKTRITTSLLTADFSEGFQTTVLPVSAGVEGRFPAIAVKLNGVTASTKPSSPRWSITFHWPGDEAGWFS